MRVRFNAEAEAEYNFGDEFDTVEVTVGLITGQCFQALGDDARDMLEGSWSPDFHLCAHPAEDVANSRVTAVTYCEAGEATPHVPLSWVSRAVRVHLEHGAVLGILGDMTLRSKHHLHLLPLPGHPAPAPLPAHLLLRCELVPHLFASSFERCADESYEVQLHKYFYQRGDAAWMCECHFKVGFFLPDFRVQYQRRVSDGGGIVAAFCRFPAPGVNIDKGKNGYRLAAAAAELDDWRFNWLSPGARPVIGAGLDWVYTSDFDEAHLNALAAVRTGYNECFDEAQLVTEAVAKLISIARPDDHPCSEADGDTTNVMLQLAELDLSDNECGPPLLGLFRQLATVFADVDGA